MSKNLKQTRSKIYKQYYEYPIPFDPEVGMDVFTKVDVAPKIEDVDGDFKKNNCYSQNPLIMKAGTEYPYTEEKEAELVRCSEDIIYFIVNYCKVITLKDGLQLLKLFQYQKNAIKIIHENRFSIFKFPRQMGKCVDGSTDIEIRINGVEMKMSISALYNMIEIDNEVESYTPNYDYEILTAEGFKDFDGITKKKCNTLIKISLEDGSIIEVTPEHKIKMFTGEYVTADQIDSTSVLGVEKEIKVISTETLAGEFTVADLISVKDTESFVVNDMSAILSNCVDGESMITLLDNVTGKIFEIEIEKLFDYLLAGSEGKLP